MKEVLKKNIKKRFNKFDNFIKFNKKSQIAVFIIVGILIIAVAAVFFILRGNLNVIKENNVDYGEALPVYNFVQSCVEKTGEDAIYQIGKTGGYVFPPNPRLEFNDTNSEGIVYYLYKNENKMPSEEKIQDELSKYMDNFLSFCIDDFSDFSDFNISDGEIKTVTKIEKNKVIFNVNYDLIVTKENKTYNFNKFNSEISVRLNETYWIIKELMEKQMKKTDAVCLSCLYESAEKNNVKINMFESKEGVVFMVNDNRSQINKYDFRFYFANQYE